MKDKNVAFFFSLYKNAIFTQNLVSQGLHPYSCCYSHTSPSLYTGAFLIASIDSVVSLVPRIDDNRGEGEALFNCQFKQSEFIYCHLGKNINQDGTINSVVALKVSSRFSGFLSPHKTIPESKLATKLRHRFECFFHPAGKELKASDPASKLLRSLSN